MSDSERRFRQRYDAAPLKIDLRVINVFGRAGKRHEAIARDFSTGGVSIITPLKMKPGKRLIVSLTSDDHSLQAIPAEILRTEKNHDHYIYALRFTMEQMPEAACRGADTVLQRLASTLQQQTQGEQRIPG